MQHFTEEFTPLNIVQQSADTLAHQRKSDFLAFNRESNLQVSQIQKQSKSPSAKAMRLLHLCSTERFRAKEKKPKELPGNSNVNFVQKSQIDRCTRRASGPTVHSSSAVYLKLKRYSTSSISRNNPHFADCNGNTKYHNKFDERISSISDFLEDKNSESFPAPLTKQVHICKLL
jgi:hypothetical protein